MIRILLTNSLSRLPDKLVEGWYIVVWIELTIGKAFVNSTPPQYQLERVGHANFDAWNQDELGKVCRCNVVRGELKLLPSKAWSLDFSNTSFTTSFTTSSYCTTSIILLYCNQKMSEIKKSKEILTAFLNLSDDLKYTPIKKPKPILRCLLPSAFKNW